MLVLQRKRGESVKIALGGEVVTVTVVEIRDGEKVRIGFTADRKVEIHREEVWNEIHGGKT